MLTRNLLMTPRERNLPQAAKDIFAETGLKHRPVADGRRVASIYRRNIMLAGVRYPSARAKHRAWRRCLPFPPHARFPRCIAGRSHRPD
ncbi:hypothetical protein [Pandoraea horticolens]|uniref:hypothetical protein n=1 Tax=Pandoraea horticolens TaxID=2508298 RepID=UPI003CCE0D00